MLCTDVTQAGPGAQGGGDAGALPTSSRVLMEQRGAPFDLTLTVFEADRTLHASLALQDDLFDPGTIARMAGQLDTLLVGDTDEPEGRIDEFPL